MSKGSVDALAELCITGAENHTSRPVSQELLHSSTKIIALDSSHLHVLKYSAPESKLSLLLDYHPDESFHRGSVMDPYGGTHECYLRTRDTILQAVDGLLVDLCRNT